MKVLICPLNWGLGHATRCIPLIRQMIGAGDEVVILADGHPMNLLIQEFPQLRFIEDPSYQITYNAGNSQVTAMLRSIPAIFTGIYREHVRLKKLIRTEKFDRIISDNRFGMWHPDVNSVYMTHQLMIKLPGMLKIFEPVVWLGHRFFINRFDACWIPDFPDKKDLSGDLSHAYPLPRHAKFIGPLSRFEGIEITESETIYEQVMIISGPEPQRTLFERAMIEQARKSGLKTLLIQGLPGNETTWNEHGQLVIKPHLKTIELASAIVGAKRIYCRSGYTTIMDLAALNCLHKAVFTPTPGQTEQEYLAKYHKKTAGV